MYVSFRFIRYNGDPILPDCTLPTCQTALIRPLRCGACRIAHYCVRHLIFLSYWPSCLLANHQNQACQRADWPRHKAMCFTPERLAADGISDEVLHPEYKWTVAEMSSAVSSFVSHHTKPIFVLAINMLRLFDVPVVGGIPDSRVWGERTRNRELVIYLDCTTTQVPFRHRFKQLGTVSVRVEPLPQPAENAGGCYFNLCIVLVTPEVDGRRTQVGMNWRFNLGLSRLHMELLHEEPIGNNEAFERLNKAIMDSRSK